MKAGWKRKPLGSILSILNGYAFDAKSFSFDTGTPLIRIRDLKNGVTTQTNFDGPFDQRYVVEAGSFLIGMDGEFGCFEWRGPDALLNQRVCKLHSFAADIDPRFLFYGINKHLKEIEDNTTFTTVKHLSSKQIANIDFVFPPLDEQRRIVAVLDKAFAGIATATANAQKNLTNARALFEGYLESAFNKKGDGWKDVPLGKACKVERGSSPRPIKSFVTTEEDGQNWIKIGDTKSDSKYVTHTKQRITPAGALKSRKVDPGDFILTNSMSFGKPYIMKISGYIHDGWFALRLNDGIDTEYFYYLLSSPIVQKQFQNLAAGAIVLNISGDLVKRAILPIPPIEQQRAIVKRIQLVDDETSRLAGIYETKLAALTELKQSLLQKAFAGELT